MPLILAIEPDKRQSSQLAAVVKGLKAELVQGASAADGLAALHGRVPDLVLTTSLISPRDDAALAAHLRDLGAAAAHVQTVTIPLLGTAAPARARGGMLAALRREKPPAPVTDGCAPDVFADQIRQYLATAEEQKAVAAIRLAAAPEDAPAEFVAPGESSEPDLAVEFVEATPVYEALPEREPEPEPEVEESATVEAPQEFVADEPAGLPLTQLLQLVSDAAPAAESPAPEPIGEMSAVEESGVEELTALEETSVEDFVVEEFIEEAEAAPAAPAHPYGDLYVDPMAAQALEELSHQAPAQSLADGIPGEAPVPVVEMQAFQSLDAIASELAAAPSQRRESLDDLASLFAAPAAAPARQESTLFVPQANEFASLFAAPPVSRRAEPIDVPGIDPSLFASAPATQVPVFEPAPEPVLDVISELFVDARPEPVLDMATAPVVELTSEPVVEPAPEPVAEIVLDPVLTEFEVPEPEPMLAADFEVESEPVFEDPPLAFVPPAVEPVAKAPVGIAATAELTDEASEFTEEAAEFDEELDEEIALDVDAFTFPEPEPAEPARFSFTLVDGFGDAWSDFEVPSVADMAAGLGVGAHAPSDPYAEVPSPSPAEARRADANGSLSAPALDAEALSLIGDAARKVSLDALVIQEFERGGQPKQVKKAKKVVHAGATHAVPAPAPERPAGKPAPRPVQDEWGMFDPEQAGFAALEDEEGAEARPTTGTRVRVISY